MNYIKLKDEIDFKLSVNNLSLTDTCIIVEDCDNGIIEGIRLKTSNRVNQLILNGCRNITVKNCDVIGGDCGIYVKHSFRINISNNAIQATSGAGILFENTDESWIDYNCIKSSQSHGVYLSGCEKNIITDNQIHHVRKNGIQCNKGASPAWLHVKHNIITNNLIDDCGYNGIALLRYAIENTVCGNTFVDIVRNDIQLSEGDPYFPENEWSRDNIVIQ